MRVRFLARLPMGRLQARGPRRTAPTHEKMTENLKLYSRVGYVEYDRRSQGELSDK